MGHHLNDDRRFQSDKYPELPPDKIVLSFTDPYAQYALRVLAQAYQHKDPELSEDITYRLNQIAAERKR